jgi:hypothetical protein
MHTRFSLSSSVQIRVIRGYISAGLTISLVPKLCFGTRLSSKLCFVVGGNWSCQDIGIPKQRERRILTADYADDADAGKKKEGEAASLLIRVIRVIRGWIFASVSFV